MTGTNMTELSPMEKLVFGQGAKRHPITGMVLEQGSGALSPDLQARVIHLVEIARNEGQAAADAMRIKLDAEQRRLAIAESEKG
jgi:hypothetical protein